MLPSLLLLCLNTSIIKREDTWKPAGIQVWSWEGKQVLETKLWTSHSGDRKATEMDSVNRHSMKQEDQGQNSGEQQHVRDRKQIWQRNLKS